MKLDSQLTSVIKNQEIREFYKEPRNKGIVSHNSERREFITIAVIPNNASQFGLK